MKANTKETVRTYWQHTVRYRSGVMYIASAMVIASALDIIRPLYFKAFFDVLAGSSPSGTVVASLITILSSILVVWLIQWALWRSSDLIANIVQSRAMSDLANACFQYLHLNSFSFFENNFGGSLVKKARWYVNAYEVIFDRFLWEFVPTVVEITLLVIVLLIRNRGLGLAVVIWLCLFVTVNIIFTRYKLRYDVIRSETETKATGLLADTITNHSIIKLFNGYRRESASFAAVTEKVRYWRRFSWNVGAVFNAIQSFFFIILQLGVMGIVVMLWYRGIATIGDFFLVQSYIITIANRMWNFGRLMQNVYERLADAEEMTVILKTPHEIVDVPSAADLALHGGAIEFRNVTFAYGSSKPILSSFSLSVRPGEHIALVGPSGAGKTTVIKLLLRTHDRTSGLIAIDGQDIAQVTQESLWYSVSLVPQDPTLFHRTIMENIKYGKPTATDDEVIEAAKRARCHEFIMALPDGYDSYVGERGIKLSGGERQRVAIARAILRDAPILVFDEATSSLDSESERLIQEALDELIKGKTVITIAHRLSTIRKMDRIVVMRGGSIVEEGTHDQLLEQKHLYSRLWLLQAGGFLPE